ncbi:exodeoxyribonuclease I [Lysobacter solisilvae (ex Woo and Kim 2020)]|uniref:Exodeoxyribonuclease I n=1 Tax=Agrilutibacter terrestris TaxID=2865112 RepID=A0A7H0FXQ0_9GAMM|nr:exodeoxyribonuclease I [Lysobacter terrestris]QNP40816.1 exodeoxyribonuclease I [Lysobacter terrestris]
MPASFLFYDLETFGADPRTTRIAQFAAIRTDADLNEVDEPISIFVRPADDLLPSPIATLITGIAPQAALRDGMNEAQAFSLIFDEMARPETCTLGYNSLRFDDEFVRYGLFRNFYDAYEREWRGGNSRWDLLDVLRLAHALRPDGLAWPQREDGATSFKLEHLAHANDVRIGDAHEALSDVRALIGLARKLKQTQPRLWDYALKLRDKRFVASLVDVVAMTPLLHVSQRFPASRLCSAPVLPLARHPRIDNRVIVFDLGQDPAALLRMSPEQIADRLYTPIADLPEGEERIALKEIHLNRCPALVAWDHLRAADFTRLMIDPQVVAERAAILREAGPALAEKVRQVYSSERERARADADASLYDGFIGDGDKRVFAEVRATPPQALGMKGFGFRDPRLPELLFRYRARNWPDTLSVSERALWNDYRRSRLRDERGLSEYSFDTFRAEIAALRLAHAADGGKQVLLDQLEAWGHEVEAGLA